MEQYEGEEEKEREEDWVSDWYVMCVTLSYYMRAVTLNNDSNRAVRCSGIDHDEECR